MAQGNPWPSVDPTSQPHHLMVEDENNHLGTGMLEDLLPSSMPVESPVCAHQSDLLYRWKVDVDICQALQREPAPATCPLECIYVPTGVREWLLTWAHISFATGHPGITRTIQSFSEKYWWPTMPLGLSRDVCSC